MNQDEDRDSGNETQLARGDSNETQQMRGSASRGPAPVQDLERPRHPKCQA